MAPIKIILPYPPSVNHYWIWTGRAWAIGKRGRLYIQAVRYICRDLAQNTTAKLKATAYVYPPDNRRRDLDNVNKAIWDSLEKAGVYENDSQIEELHLYKLAACKPGRVEILLEGFEL